MNENGTRKVSFFFYFVNNSNKQMIQLKQSDHYQYFSTNHVGHAKQTRIQLKKQK